MIEVNDGVLLLDDRHAQKDLPTGWGLNEMMVMDLREPVVHIGRQYTNRRGIWQVSLSFERGFARDNYPFG